MKSRVLLILTLVISHVIQCFGQSPFQKIYAGQELSFVLSEIESHFGIQISYLEETVDGITVNKSLKAANPENALNTALEITGLVFTKLNGSYVLAPGKKQSYQLRGFVRDNNKIGIPGATVWIQDQLIGVATDTAGYFELSLENGAHEIMVTSVGFQSQTKTINFSESMDLKVVLAEDRKTLETVEVVGNSFSISTGELSSHGISKKEILHSPAPFRDIFRTLKVLPGYSNDDISAKARIRGGHWDETAIFLDNMEIYEPYHLEEVEGLAGIFETDLITSVKVQTGGFTSRYTDKMSGIIEMQTSDYFPKNETSMSIDFLSAKVITQQNVGENSSFIFSGRRGYLDFILDTDNEGIKPRYFDLFSKYQTAINNKHHVSLDVLYAQDDLLFARENALIRSEYFNSHRKNIYVWSNWSWLVSKDFYSQTTIGFQQLKKDADFAFEASLSPENKDYHNSKIASLLNRTYWDGWENHNVEFGTEWKFFNSQYIFDEARITPSVPDELFVTTDIIDVNSDFSGGTYAIYFQDSWRLNPKLNFLYGLRTGGQTFTSGLQFAPRGVLSYELTPAIIASTSVGRYFQPDNFQKLRSYDGQGLPSNMVGECVHYNLNLSHHAGAVITKITAYLKDYKSLFDDYRYDFYNRASLASLIETPFNTVRGEAKGIEIFSRYQMNQHMISLAYGLSKSTIFNIEGQQTARDFDRLHSLSINSIFNFKKDFSISGTWNYYSGGPFTPNQISFVGEPKWNSDAILYYDFGEKNSSRMPDYHSLDIKGEKTIFREKKSFNFYVSVLNLYNRVNKRNYSWNAVSIDEEGNNVYQRSYISGPEFFISPGLKVIF